MNNSKSTDIYAKVLSLIFYPSFIQTVISSFIIRNAINQWAVWLCFFFLPILFSVLYLNIVKMPKNHTWVVPKEFRIFPLSFALIGTIVFFVFFTHNERSFLKIITLSSILLTAIALPITYFWKVSLHMIGMGAFSTFLVIFFNFHWFSVCFALIVSHQVAWARMYLKSHDLWQVLIGYLLGILCFLIAFIYYQNNFHTI